MSIGDYMLLWTFVGGTAPFVVFYSVKLGVFGYYRARQLFEEFSKKGK